MRILVTGGLGYLGSQVSYNLLENGIDVSIIDILPTNPFKKISGASYTQLDITNYRELKNYFNQNKFDQVIHLAAKKSVLESMEFPDLYKEVNIRGTANLLELAANQDCPNFIFASSAAVYAESESGFVSEDSELAPENPYGESKLESELLVAQFVRESKLKACSLRLFNLSGEGEGGLANSGEGSLLPVIISKMKKNEPVQVFGDCFMTKDGSASRDYIHVLDASDCFLLVSRLLRDKEIPNTLNIATGRSTTVLEMIEQARVSSSSKIDVKMETARFGEIGRMIADVRKSVEHLGPYVTRDLESIVTSALRAIS
jgi:UDP-glucose 4-epimerase